MADMKAAAERYARDLAKVTGERLRSVVLHGSVARGEAVEGVSDVNLLVLLERVDAGILRELAPHARRWLERERALPLVLTWDEWRAASDAFAIETADMLDARLVLHGDDPLAGVAVADRHLRLQAERELRGKLIHLREGTLAMADRPKELGGLVTSALPSVATYLRAALRLAGEVIGERRTGDVLESGSTLVGADAGPLLELWDQRQRHTVPRLEVDDPRVTATYAVLERTVHYVDTFSGESA